MENLTKKIVALLGPTNTGNTHLAFERLISYHKYMNKIVKNKYKIKKLSIWKALHWF